MEETQLEDQLMRQMAPQLYEAVEELDFETVQLFISHDFQTDFRVTSTGITIYSLVMGVDQAALEAIEDGPMKYIKTLKMLRKKHPNLLATDDLDRNCFHHAASANNALGLSFTVAMYNDLLRKQ